MLLYTFNLSKQNVTSHSYQLSSPFPNLRVVRLELLCYQNSNRTFCKQTVETLIRRRVLRRLIWVCTVCLCPTKKTLGLKTFINIEYMILLFNWKYTHYEICAKLYNNHILNTFCRCLPFQVNVFIVNKLNADSD